jgi:hypothetical protein
MASYLVVLVLLLVTGCASLGSRTEGASGPVSWKAEDMELAQRTVETRRYWSYSFSLVVRETRGVGITFNEIRTAIYQPGTGSGGATYRGAWTLPANGAFRIPLSSSLGCPSGVDICLGTGVPIPLWKITLIGTDDAGGAVREVVDLRMPPDPPPSPVKRAESIPAISLAPSRPGRAGK